MHPLGPERIDRDRGRERRIDAAREPQHDAREAVLLDVVAQAQAHRAIDRLEAEGRRRDLALDAGPALVLLPLPAGDQQLLLERPALRGEAPVGVEHEGRAIEHQLVLAADLVAVDQRQAGLGDPRDREVEAHVRLVVLVGRAVGHDQDLGAGLLEPLGDVLGPHVLAHHAADAQLPAARQRERHRPGDRAGGEHALLVEHAVIGQIVLVARGHDPAAGEQQHRVVELAALAPGRAQDHRRAAVRGIGGEGLDRAARDILERALEHQVLGRVADHHQLREHRQIGAGRSGARAEPTDQP